MTEIDANLADWLANHVDDDNATPDDIQGFFIAPVVREAVGHELANAFNAWWYSSVPAIQEILSSGKGPAERARILAAFQTAQKGKK